MITIDLIPNIYTPVTYIQALNTNCIIEFTAPIGLKPKLVFEYLNLNASDDTSIFSPAFSTSDAGNANMKKYGFGATNKTLKFSYCYGKTNAWSFENVTIDDNVPLYAEFGETVLCGPNELNATLRGTATGYDFSSYQTKHLRIPGGTSTNLSSISYGRTKQYDNETLVHDLIPVYINRGLAKGDVGMYDLVTDSFFLGDSNWGTSEPMLLLDDDYEELPQTIQVCKVSQSEDIPEEVSLLDIEYIKKLAKIKKQARDKAKFNLSGTLHAPIAYSDSKELLEELFPSLYVTTDKDGIRFEDNIAEDICLRLFDFYKDGVISADELSKYNSIGTYFSNNKLLRKFNELLYFTECTTFLNTFNNNVNLLEITLPPALDEEHYITLVNSPFLNCDSLTTIHNIESIKYIGDNAFSSCPIEEVNLPLVTSVTRQSFYNARIKRILLPNFNNTIPPGESLNSIGLFSNNSRLEYVDLSSLTSLVLSGMFRACSNLLTVKVSESLTLIGDAVFRDSGLLSIILPNTLLTIGSLAFANCNRLTSIDIPSSVTSLGYLSFYYCTNLERIKISGIPTFAGLNFNGCNKLYRVDIDNLSNWCKINFSSVLTGVWPCINPLCANKANSGLWLNGERLTDIVIPSDITILRTNAFGYAKFNSLTIPASVVQLGVFSATTENLYLANWDQLWYFLKNNNDVSVNGDGNFSIGCKNLYINEELVTSITLPLDITLIGKSLTGVTSIKEFIVNNTSTILSFSALGGTTFDFILVPITTLNTTPFRHNTIKRLKLFGSALSISSALTGGSSNIEILDVSEVDFSECTTLSFAFSFNKFTRIDGLDTMDTSSVISMRLVFGNCTFNINLSNWNVSKVTDMSNMFINYTGANLNLSNWNLNSNVNITGMFQNCTGLTILNLSGWDLTNVTVPSDLFNDCGKLAEIHLSNCNTATISKILNIKSERTNIIE